LFLVIEAVFLSSRQFFAQAFFQKAWQAFGKAPDSYNLGEIFAQAFFQKAWVIFAWGRFQPYPQSGGYGYKIEEISYLDSGGRMKS